MTRTYLITLHHDAGEVVIATAADSADDAVRLVLAAENAPRSAVRSVRVSTIETVGAVVRGPHGALSEIVEVLEYTRAPSTHLSIPGDVVVRVKPHGPGYAHESAWASELRPSQPGDIGAHPHRADCVCGADPPNPQPHWGWVPVSATWEA